MEGNAFLQGHATRFRGSTFLRVTKENEPQGAVGGIKAKPIGKFPGASDRRSRPEGTEASLVRREQQILHRTGGSADFVELRNLATKFHMGGNGDNGLGLVEALAKLRTLLRADVDRGGDLIIKGL